MACGMEHGMEYGMCLIYLLKDNYVTTTTFRGIYNMVLCTVASPGEGGCMWIHTHPVSTPVHSLKCIF